VSAAEVVVLYGVRDSLSVVGVSLGRGCDSVTSSPVWLSKTVGSCCRDVEGVSTMGSGTVV
jgi:hypothetical protein